MVLAVISWTVSCSSTMYVVSLLSCCWPAEFCDQKTDNSLLASLRSSDMTLNASGVNWRCTSSSVSYASHRAVYCQPVPLDCLQTARHHLYMCGWTELNCYYTFHEWCMFGSDFYHTSCYIQPQFFRDVWWLNQAVVLVLVPLLSDWLEDGVSTSLRQVQRYLPVNWHLSLCTVCMMRQLVSDCHCCWIDWKLIEKELSKNLRFWSVGQLPPGANSHKANCVPFLAISEYGQLWSFRTFKQLKTAA